MISNYNTLYLFAFLEYILRNNEIVLSFNVLKIGQKQTVAYSSVAVLGSNIIHFMTIIHKNISDIP